MALWSSGLVLKTSSMGDHSGILVTIEGWGVNLAGCYGNALLPTPSIDRLAAHGIVFDQFWMHSTYLEPNLQAILQKIHPSRWLVASDSIQATSMLRHIADLDRLDVTHDPDRESFDHLLTEALESWLQQRQQTPFLWIHSKGLAGPWDAPYAYRQLMCDADDPDPPKDTDPPELVLSKDFDPDLLFGLACGAGAQSVVIDQGIGLILQTLKEIGIEENCWIALAGILGFPLGEHRRVGLGHRSLDPTSIEPSRADAYSERLHTPWMIRPAPEMKLGTRLNRLLQPRDLGDWIELLSDGRDSKNLVETYKHATLAWAAGDGEIALLTEHWSARFDTSKDPNAVVSILEDRIGEIYCFPEDRWQQNEIGNRVPAVQILMRQIASILLLDHHKPNPQSDRLSELLSDLSTIRR